MGHRDPWESIFQLRQDAGALLKFIWTPSCMRVGGNEKADELAETGREMHPNNKKRRGGSDRVPRLWQDAGLSPMHTDVSSSKSSGDSSSVLSSRASVGGDLTSVANLLEASFSSVSSCAERSSKDEDSGFSAGVSDRQRERKKRLRAR